VGIGAKDQSNHRVAGSLRSFPQDSWDFLYIFFFQSPKMGPQFGPLKRMIRGLGVETTSTYSQTLNGPETQVA